jgi:uncharacterized protein with beta-barrel porin domain
MKYNRPLPWWVAVCAALLVVGNPCRAQAVQGPLVDLINSGQYNFNALERFSAIANQASYNSLTSNPGAPIYCNPLTTIAPGGTCNGGVFLVFSNLRSLVQTANALLANGQATRYSLNLTDQALGFALRWTAGENLSAPGSAATQFANGQIASLASRITALRFGAIGFSADAIPAQTGGAPTLAWTSAQSLGGGASADNADIGIASRWGGFLNGSYGWGQRAPSVLEDAFWFDSKDATLGVDYRFTRRFVLGMSVGYTNQRIEFNSLESVAGGNIDSHGYGLQLYGLYEWEGPYISASLGTQRMQYSSSRLITYPSFNIAVPSVNATATGSTNSESVTATLNFGWPLIHKGFTFEPYLSNQYEKIHLDGFRESSVNNGGPNAGQPAGFDFDYAAQELDSLDSAIGARFQYAFLPPFGVIVPFVKAEFHHRFIAPTSAVVSAYNAIASDGTEFNIPSDEPNLNFYEFAGGASLVLKHGIQAFVQYQTSARIAYVSSHMISAGIRGEF